MFGNGNFCLFTSLMRLLKQLVTSYILADLAGSSSSRCSFLGGQIHTCSPICSFFISWNCYMKMLFSRTAIKNKHQTKTVVLAWHFSIVTLFEDAQLIAWELPSCLLVFTILLLKLMKVKVFKSWKE